MFLEERGVRGSLYLLILYFNSLLLYFAPLLSVRRDGARGVRAKATPQTAWPRPECCRVTK
jgi:hypothetical protein